VDEAARPAPALSSDSPSALVDRLEAPAAGALLAATAVVTATLPLRLSDPGDSQLVPAAALLALMAAIIAGLGIGLRSGRSWTIALCVGLPAFVLGMASVALDVDQSPAGAQEKPRLSIVAPTPKPVGPTSQTIAFGTGGTGCSVASDTRDFTPGAHVRFGVTFDPPLPPGTTIRVRVTRDSALVFNFRRSVGTETACYTGDFSTAGLQVGRYLWSLTHDGSGEPATQVAFVLVEATSTISTSPTPGPVEPTATPISPTAEPVHPTAQTVAFGTGGSGCVVEHDTRSFAPGAQVRFGVTFDPPLPPGTTMRVLVTRDSEPVFDTARTIELETACYSGELSMARLRMGFYRWSLTYDGARQAPTEEMFSLLRP
jgi:hypothetical protein